ncbi:protein phosphatase 2C domain-containing protein, partial [Chloroflexus sp.]
MGVSSTRFDVGAHTDRGRQRSNNEDAIGRADQWSYKGQKIQQTQREQYGRLYIVADGVGGHNDGEVASRMVVNEVIRLFYTENETLSTDPVERLKAVIREASTCVYNESQRRQNNMRSTIVAALAFEDRVVIANVGDSRAYIVRDDTIKQLSLDHSRRRQDGLSVLTQAMGDPDVSPATFTTPWRDGDRIVLCSDGLTDLVDAEEIANIVRQKSAQEATKQLIKLANQRGGHDNISVVVIHHAPSVESVAADKGNGSIPIDRRFLLIAVLLIGMLSVSGVGALLLAGQSKSLLNSTTQTTIGQTTPTQQAYSSFAEISNQGAQSNNQQVSTSTLVALSPTATETAVPPPTNTPRPTAVRTVVATPTAPSQQPPSTQQTLTPLPTLQPTSTPTETP